MRKTLQKLAAFMFIVSTISLLVNVIDSNAAFGSSPPWVRNDHLLPGTTYEETIYLSRSSTEEAVKINTELKGDGELIGWMSIPDKDTLVMEQGQVILPMKVLINVPENAALKRYEGSIFATYSSLEEGNQVGGGEVAIGLGANITVDISVIGEEIEDYRIKSVEVEPAMVDDPFAVTVTVQNTGNTEIRNLEGTIDVLNNDGTESIKELSFLPPKEPLAFNETKKIDMVYEDFKPAPGTYWVDVEAFKEGESIYKNRVLQEVKTEEVPVIMPEDAVLLPIDEGEKDVIPSLEVMPLSETQQATSIINKVSSIYFIIGLLTLLAAAVAYILRK